MPLSAARPTTPVVPVVLVDLVLVGPPVELVERFDVVRLTLVFTDLVALLVVVAARGSPWTPPPGTRLSVVSKDFEWSCLTPRPDCGFAFFVASKSLSSFSLSAVNDVLRLDGLSGGFVSDTAAVEL